MTIRLYNTLTRSKEEFVPLEAGKVKMYHCGPMVYDYVTVGNHRTFLFADVLRRYLESRGFAVKQVMNLTDVGHFTVDDVLDESGEDKMAAAARREKKTPEEVASFYIGKFMEDRAFLGYRQPDVFPRATDNIREMIAIIESLLRKRHAYVAGGQVYFDISSFPSYGSLSGNTQEALEAGARVQVHPDKRHPHDFALWKIDPDHAQTWESPWGRGFPGWHVECSAMAMRYLGVTLDIHTGGEDNLFPHHECEIAQSESATGDPFVRYWLHTRHLLVNGEKMSKSKGNVYTMQGLKAMGYDGPSIRYALISTHYRQQQNFTLESLDAAVKTVDRINDFVRRLEGEKKARVRPEIAEAVRRSEEAFVAAMDDDLNISEALASVFELMTAVNRVGPPFATSDAAMVRARMESVDDVLGILDREPPPTYGDEEEIQQLVEDRTRARNEGDFARADHIRDALRARGIVIEDGAGGTRWHRG